MAYTTSRRMFLLSTPLGEDALLINEFEGTERVSHLFHFKLTMLSERDDIDADDLLGKRVTLRIETVEDERHWTGLVSSFLRTGQVRAPGANDEMLTRYQCEIVPWLWPLTLNEDSRVFQNQSIPDIVETILNDFELRDYHLDLRGDYPPLTYCTQYQESNFDFISRLLEQAGIYYYVKYDANTETVVFTDNNDANPDLDPSFIRFADEGSTKDEDSITALNRRSHLRSGRVVMRDYNFEKPADALETSVDSLVRIGDNHNYERFVYPGQYDQQDQGERIARVQMEAEEAEHEILDGASTVRGLAPGHCFELEGHPLNDLNQELMVLSVRHHGRNNVGEESASSTYSNVCAFIPRKVPYREPKRTPKSRILGPQIATVVGPSGEEIHTDKYGRIKIQFPWDRRGEFNDKSSCWVRVVHSHAGAKWGGFMLPRIGEEVLVAFEHGDPDRPLIVGSLYNANNMPPYDLPAEATKSTLKTNSSKGGNGFNELRFEDRAGNEEIFLHGQKDLQIRIRNDSIASIERDSHETIAESRYLQVGKDRHQQVDGNDILAVDGLCHRSVGKGYTCHAQQDMELGAGSNVLIGADMNAHMSSGMNLVLDAGMQISLKAGPSSITLGPAGVTIDGPLLRLNCGGSPLTANKPQKPDKPDKPIGAIEAEAGKVSDVVQQIQAQALRKAAAQAQPFCAECKAASAALRAMS